MSELVTNDKQAMRALKQHGNKIITVIALVLVAFFGWQFYQKNYAKIDTVAADKYTAVSQAHEALTLLAQNPDDAANADSAKQKLYADIDALVVAHPNTVYAWQALMIKARYQTDDEDLAGAIASLSQAAASKVEDDGLIAIAKLRYAQVALANKDTETAMRLANEPMPSAFEASRQELLGDIYVAQNEPDNAKKAYAQAWQHLAERHENRALLGLKMQALGMDVTPIEPKAQIIATPNQAQNSDMVAILPEMPNSDTAKAGSAQGDNAQDGDNAAASAENSDTQN